MQGLLLLNKPEGKTSFSVVSAIKRTANEKRVGHTGTLDPMATGVLPVLIGRATALSSLMLDADKRYIAKISFGITTDTDDITGKILSHNEVNLTLEEIQSALEHFKGEIMQKPPIYSAIKKDGVRLYQLARQGKSVEISDRKITVFDIDLLNFSENQIIIETHVSKGTYIRSLARDIGEYLGCGATLCALERTYASGFSIDQCVKLEDINSQSIAEYLYSEEKAVEHLPIIYVTAKQAARFCNGGQLAYDRLHIELPVDAQLFRVKLDEKLLGIGFADNARSQIGIKCIINYPEE